MRVLFSDLRKDKFKFGEYIWVLRVAMSMKSGKRIQCFLRAVVIAEPPNGRVSLARQTSYSAVAKSYLGDSGKKKIKAPRKIDGMIWIASGIRHSRLSPVPAQVM